MGFDLSICQTSEMIKTAEKLKIGQNEAKSEKGFRAHSSQRVDKNGVECNVGFGRMTEIIPHALDGAAVAPATQNTLNPTPTSAEGARATHLFHLCFIFVSPLFHLFEQAATMQLISGGSASEINEGSTNRQYHLRPLRSNLDIWRRVENICAFESRMRHVVNTGRFEFKFLEKKVT